MDDGLLRKDKADDKEIIKVISCAVQYSSSRTENTDRDLKGRSFELEIFALYQMAFGSELYCESLLANEIRKHKDDLSAIVTALQKDDDLYQKARFALDCFMDWLEYQRLSHPENRENVRKELMNLQGYTKMALERIEQCKGMNKGNEPAHRHDKDINDRDNWEASELVEVQVKKKNDKSAFFDHCFDLADDDDKCFYQSLKSGRPKKGEKSQRDYLIPLCRKYHNKENIEGFLDTFERWFRAYKADKKSG